MRNRLTIIFLFIAVSLSAQNNNAQYDKYKGVERLPYYIYDTAGNTAWGVSDPGLDSLSAKKQAVLRAVFLYALKQKVDLRMLTDNYLRTEKQTNRYDYNYGKYITLANITIPSTSYRYKITDEHMTDREEYYVSLSFNDCYDDIITISSQCDFMSCINQASHESIDYKILTNTEVQDVDGVNNDVYTLTGSFSFPVIEAQFNDIKNIYTRESYWYKDENNMTVCEKQYNLYNGLWCAVIESLCDAVVTTEFSDVTLKDVDENYTHLTQTMTREKTDTDIVCMPDVYGIKSNKLSMVWHITQHF